MARKKKAKTDRKKTLSYVVVPRTGEPGKAMYRMLKELVQEHHEDLRDARIALAWATSWKADPDGRLKLGKLKKIGDPDRELMEIDAVVILNRDFWTDPEVKDEQRAALLDHELCHLELKYDEDGEPLEDEKSRKIFRLRKHDIEEFSQIVARHGLYKKDLEDFAKAIWRSKQGKLDFKRAETEAGRRFAIDDEEKGPASEARPSA